ADLRRRVSLAQAAARRADRTRGDLSGRRFPRSGPRTRRPRRILVLPDALLAVSDCAHAARAVRARHARGPPPGGGAFHDAGVDRGLDQLPLARHRGAGLLVVSVGLAPARDRSARALSLSPALGPARLRGAAGASRDLPAALAALSADVLLGGGQADERRSNVALAHRAAIPLRDAAAAALDRAVRASFAGGLPEVIRAGDVRHGSLDPVPHLRTAPRALRRRGGPGRASAPDPRHRQLRHLQPAGHRPLPDAARRSAAPGAVARRAAERRPAAPAHGHRPGDPRWGVVRGEPGAALGHASQRGGPARAPHPALPPPSAPSRPVPPPT